MRSFDEILAIAAKRKGGVDAARSGVIKHLPPEELAGLPDSRWLAAMAHRIFKAGLNDAVINRKWSGITEAFNGFEPASIAMMSDEDVANLASDPRMIRSAPRVAAIRDNAIFICEAASEFGSFGRHVTDWPVRDQAGLISWLMKNGSYLGGNSAQYVLRLIGKESWLLTTSVVARLEAEGVEIGKSRSVATLNRAQAAFNHWQDESGESLNMISHVLAVSIDNPR